VARAFHCCNLLLPNTTASARTNGPGFILGLRWPKNSKLREHAARLPKLLWQSINWRVISKIKSDSSTQITNDFAELIYKLNEASVRVQWENFLDRFCQVKVRRSAVVVTRAKTNHHHRVVPNSCGSLNPWSSRGYTGLWRWWSDIKGPLTQRQIVS